MDDNEEGQECMKRSLIILIVITCVAAVLRLYKLDQIPPGLYQDETAIAYNAYSIRMTGKDEYGRKFPLYFESFGDWKLPVYIYATALSQQIFGLNAFSVRFPSAIFGILTVFVFFSMVKQITDDENLSLLSALFLALTPWHIHYSRATFEVSIVLFLFVTGTYLLLKSFSQKHTGSFFLGTLCFIFAIYTYNLTRLFSPLLYASIIFFNLKKKKTISSSEYGITAFTAFLLLIPFVLTLSSAGGAKSAAGTLIFSSAAVQAPLLEFRSYLVSYPFLNRLVFNSLTLTLWQYLQNIASYLSVPFFFITGSTHGNHGIGTNGQFYLFELPLMISAIYTLFKNNKKLFFTIITPAILTIIVASLTRENPQATRSFTLLLTTPMLSACGALLAGRWMNKKNQNVKYGLWFMSSIVIVFSLLQYGVSYLLRFPTAYATAWRTADKDVGLYLKQHEGKYKKIIIDSDAGLIYSSVLFYTLYPPAQFQTTVSRLPKDSEGFSEIASFGKYEYKKIDWVTDYQEPDSLIITTLKNKPSEIPALVNFVYPTRPVVVALKQQIVQFPTQDTAYVAVESHP